MVAGLAAETHLKREFAVQALDTNGWNYAETLQKVKELIATSRLPPSMLEQQP